MRSLLPVCWLIPAAMLFAAPMPDAAAKDIFFTGMCDASAAAAVDAAHFIVADDEDNILRVYKREGGAPVFEHDLSAFLGNQGAKTPKGVKKSKEADVEAAAQIGALTFWITSHGRNSKGQEKPERQRFFATKIETTGGRIEVKHVGVPYHQLIEDLIADKRLAAYGFAEAAQRPPKTPGALNIEGLATTPENHLLLGFRNPTHKGKALIVPLLNPLEVIEGARARLGEPIELALGGLSIRGMGYSEGRYVIVAGAVGSGGESLLYEWDGKNAPRLNARVKFKGLNPECMAFPKTGEITEYLVLSDDGTEIVGGGECKDLEDASKKRFRGRFVELQ